jgi:hypothetical protein
LIDSERPNKICAASAGKKAPGENSVANSRITARFGFATTRRRFVFATCTVLTLAGLCAAELTQDSSFVVTVGRGANPRPGRRQFILTLAGHLPGHFF